MKPPEERRIHLVDVRLQLALAAKLAVLTAAALILQHALFRGLLAMHSQELFAHDHQRAAVLVDLLQQGSLISVLLFLPLVFVAGILATHRVAGPLYRFRRYLEELEAGRQAAACTIRDGDALQDFCKLLNRATRPLRKPEGAPKERAGAGRLVEFEDFRRRRQPKPASTGEQEGELPSAGEAATEAATEAEREDAAS